MKSTGKLSPLFGILFLITSTLACNLPTSAPTQQADLSPEAIANTLRTDRTSRRYCNTQRICCDQYSIQTDRHGQHGDKLPDRT